MHFRKFRKKVESSGLLREMQERMHYAETNHCSQQKKNAAEKRLET
jgi:ribosomal protein S21